MGAITFPISSMNLLEGVTGLADFERLVVQNIKSLERKIPLRRFGAGPT